jgi:hypothetical protein
VTGEVVPLRPRPAPSLPMTMGQLRQVLEAVPDDALVVIAGRGPVTRATTTRVQELDDDRQPVGPADVRVVLR